MSNESEYQAEVTAYTESFAALIEGLTVDSENVNSALAASRDLIKGQTAFAKTLKAFNENLFEQIKGASPTDLSPALREKFSATLREGTVKLNASVAALKAAILTLGEKDTGLKADLAEESSVLETLTVDDPNLPSVEGGPTTEEPPTGGGVVE